MPNSSRVINISQDQKYVVVYSDDQLNTIVELFDVTMCRNYKNPKKAIAKMAKDCFPEATVHPELKAWVKA